jgi:hypothetical protein
MQDYPGPWRLEDRVIKDITDNNVSGLCPSRMSPEVTRLVIAAPAIKRILERLCDSKSPKETAALLHSASVLLDKIEIAEDEAFNALAFWALHVAEGKDEASFHGNNV